MGSCLSVNSGVQRNALNGHDSPGGWDGHVDERGLPVGEAIKFRCSVVAESGTKSSP
jgi:hypothetical protein